MGRNYWFNWAITLAAELVAAGVIMSFWFPDAPSWIWAAIFLILLAGLNFLSAKAFGEGEFWFAAIKVTAVLAFLVLGVLMIAGILGGTSPGVSNWTTGEAPFVGGWMSVISVFMIAGFSFQGTELVGVTAGESENPRKDKLGDVSLQTSVSEFMNIGTVAGQVSQLYLCDVLAREYEKLNKVDIDKIKEQALAAVMKKSI